jgi:hypothetical protein
MGTIQTRALPFLNQNVTATEGTSKVAVGVQVLKKGKSVTCTTEELTSLSSRNQETLEVGILVAGYLRTANTV